MEQIHPHNYFLRSGCLSPEGLDAYCGDAIDAPMRERLKDHLLHCDLCRNAVEGGLGAGKSVDFHFWVEDINSRVVEKVSQLNEDQSVSMNVSRGTPWGWIAAAASLALLVASMLWMVLLRDPGFPSLTGNFEPISPDGNTSKVLPDPALATIIWPEEDIDSGIQEENDGIKDAIPSTQQVIAEEEDALRAEGGAADKAIASDITGNVAHSPGAGDSSDFFAPVLAQKEAVPGSATREAAVDKAAPATQEARLINTEMGTYQSMTSPSSSQSVFNTESITYTLSGPKTVFTVAEQMPSFPGGPQALQVYFDREIKLPPGLVFWTGDTLMVAEVVIDEQGQVRQARIVQGINKDVDNLVRKALRRMPSWDPGRNRGTPVAAKTLVPVRLKGKSAQ